MTFYESTKSYLARKRLMQDLLIILTTDLDSRSSSITGDIAGVISTHEIPELPDVCLEHLE